MTTEIYIRYSLKDALLGITSDIYDSLGNVVAQETEEAMEQRRQFMEGKVVVRASAEHDGKHIAIEGPVVSPEDLPIAIELVTNAISRQVARKIAPALLA